MDVRVWINGATANLFVSRSIKAKALNTHVFYYPMVFSLFFFSFSLRSVFG